MKKNIFAIAFIAIALCVTSCERQPVTPSDNPQNTPRVTTTSDLLTSSLRHPKIFVKEFFDGFVTFHDHCSGEELSIERKSDLYGSNCFGHAKHLVYA